MLKQFVFVLLIFSQSYAFAWHRYDDSFSEEDLIQIETLLDELQSLPTGRRLIDSIQDLLGTMEICLVKVSEGDKTHFDHTTLT
jgi:hypothetical protein